MTIEFTDDATYSETGTPNPFIDRRLDVTFTGPSNQTYKVPGYFAADGNAAETSATTGDKWHVKFSPDEIGTWTYTTSFREGTDVAVIYPSSINDGTSGAIDGQSGSFVVTTTDKTGKDFRGKGRLQYDGSRYPRFTETGEYFIKAGPDSPENFLAYDEFDEVYHYAAPNRIKDWDAHLSLWQTGDPQWQGTRGRSIIGAVNYIADVKGLNAISFLTMNKVRGDTKDVTMNVDVPGSGQQAGGPIPDYTHYDVSRTAQWDIVFSYAQAKGVFLHFKTQEQENAGQLDEDPSNPGGFLGRERKLYYRELVARFGHHLVLNWNMGEENEGNTAQSPQNAVDSPERIAQLQYVADIDPYNHLRVVHSKGSNAQQDALYNPLLGNNSTLTGVSLQSARNAINDRVKHWIDQSGNAGKQWVISSDETGAGATDNQAFREEKIYGTYFAGGYGIEVYVSGQDLTLADWSSGVLSNVWDYCRYGLEFMNRLPFTEMTSDNSVINGTGNLAFVKTNDTYAIYLASASGTTNLDLGNTGDTFTVQWFDPRNGGDLQNGNITSVVSNGTEANLGSPPSNTSADWVVLVKNTAASLPSITINNVSVEEGANAVFTVTLDSDASGGFTVDFTTANNTAVSGVDYTANSGTLTFTGTAGEQQTITVNTTDDTDSESTEQFFVNLSNISNTGVSIDDPQGVGTINDNDSVTSSITISDETSVEGEDLIFEVILDNAVSGGFTVDFVTSDDGADAGADYTASSGTLTFAGTAGEVQRITINTNDDSVAESAEGLIVTLSNLSNTSVNLAKIQGFGTITDNDASISINDITVAEGENLVFTVNLNGSVSGGFNVDFTTADNTAISGEDYTQVSGSLSFAGTNGETQTISITTSDDTAVENTEQFFVNLSNLNTNLASITDGQGVGTINDNDTVSSSEINISDITVIEGEQAILQVTSSLEITGGFTVDFTTQDVTAISGQDYEASSGTLTFVGNADEAQQIIINTTDDGIVENTESFSVALSNATSNDVIIVDGESIVTLVDNDTAGGSGSISINDVSAIEGEQLSFAVTFIGQIDGGFSINYQAINGSATADEDYEISNGLLSFSGINGETLSINISSIDDNLVEGTEQFTIELSNPTSNGVTIQDGIGEATIIDNDAAPVISLTDGSAVEGSPIQISMSIDKTYSEDIRLNFGFTNNETNNLDFDNQAILVTIAAGAQEAELSIPTFTDNEVEENETFTIGIISVEQGVISNIDATAIGTILDGPAENNDIDPDNIIVAPVPLYEGNTISIRDTANGDHEIALFGISGNLILNKNISITNNMYQLVLNPDLVNGIYVVELKELSSQKVYVKTIVLNR
ncbi:DUF5060 domain-containing protein [Spongiivirga citrea]|uniref:DUF5060 domain-containing protein n=1 Tax=Spongiivirga citrea TaxID=1481457 RepID=A0A6M0CN20_9FLAO|nr:DUF5060 domain-containing protein [Spongiivirga citrea]